MHQQEINALKREHKQTMQALTAERNTVMQAEQESQNGLRQHFTSAKQMCERTLRYLQNVDRKEKQVCAKWTGSRFILQVIGPSEHDGSMLQTALSRQTFCNQLLAPQLLTA